MRDWENNSIIVFVVWWTLTIIGAIFFPLFWIWFCYEERKLERESEQRREEIFIRELEENR